MGPDPHIKQGPSNMYPHPPASNQYQGMAPNYPPPTYQPGMGPPLVQPPPQPHNMPRKQSATETQLPAIPKNKSVKRTASAPGEEDIYEGIPEVDPPSPPNADGAVYLTALDTPGSPGGYDNGSYQAQYVKPQPENPPSYNTIYDNMSSSGYESPAYDNRKF